MVSLLMHICVTRPLKCTVTPLTLSPTHPTHPHTHPHPPCHPDIKTCYCSDNMYYVLFTLQRIRLMRNGLVTISSTAFSGLKWLKVLEIESNILSHAPDLRSITHSLELLYLDTGRFISNPHYFTGCNAIRHVFFINAHMTDLFWGLADVSDTAIEFNFAHNKVTSLSPLYEVNFHKLETLQLRGNAIDVISLTKLHLPVLKYFDISENYLIQLDDPNGLVLGSKLTRLSPMHFHIWGNPWHCNGTFNWLVKQACNWQEDFIFLSQSRMIATMEVNRAPSQYKDRLISVWRFPC